MTTTEQTLVAGPMVNGRGYRRLGPGPAEEPLVRTDLGAGVPGGEALLSVAHLSDLHVCDAQSPARAEFLDRWSDPDSPLRSLLHPVGTYRAQELLTAQVVEAAVQSVNQLDDVDLALVTGDATDNAQRNELDWYLRLLEGGTVHPDSGDRSRWEGVGGPDDLDDRFWHPTGPLRDRPRRNYGFPEVRGLLDACRRPFPATGLALPWLAVHGNHDQMLQGTVPAVGALGAVSTGAHKPVALPAGWSDARVLALLEGLERCDPEALRALFGMTTRLVTPDPGREVTSRQGFVAAHFGAAARPPGHGFVPSGVSTGQAWYAHDHGQVRLLVLDTVDEHGGWQGSLDRDQREWLGAELAEADRTRRYVVLASHHPLETLVNAAAGGGGPRVLEAEVRALLRRHRCVVLWLAGHIHRNAVTAHGTFWQVTAPSLIDWPQQTRLVRLLRNTRGQLTVEATMVDHAGPAPWSGDTGSPVQLAGLSRELAANAWQRRHHNLSQHPRAGTRTDRNVRCLLPDPWT